MKPLVSVIIPNYNHSQYLDQRIQSVLDQTYSNLEIIILDDKSTDNSLDIISKYLYDKRICEPIVSEINSGSPFPQWKKGIDMAKGEWIWIAESDDYADSRFIETQMKCAIDKNCIASFCSIEHVDERGKMISKSMVPNNTIVYSPSKFALYNCIGPLVQNTSSAIFKASIAKKMSSTYTKYKACGDTVFWMEYSQNGNICRCPDILANFRKHTDSTSSVARMNGKAVKERMSFIEWGRRKGYINLFEYYLMTGQKLLELKYAYYDSQKMQKELIQGWSDKVRFPYLAIFMYKVCKVLFRSHYTY